MNGWIIASAQGMVGCCDPWSHGWMDAGRKVLWKDAFEVTTWIGAAGKVSKAGVAVYTAGNRYMDVSKIVGFPAKSSILIGFSIMNHPFWGTPIFGNTHMDIVIP